MYIYIYACVLHREYVMVLLDFSSTRHGGSPPFPCQVHSAWVEGQIHVVVATVAFGMGINKAPRFARDRHRSPWNPKKRIMSLLHLVAKWDKYIFGNLQCIYIYVYAARQPKHPSVFDRAAGRRALRNPCGLTSFTASLLPRVWSRWQRWKGCTLFVALPTQ